MGLPLGELSSGVRAAAGDAGAAMRAAGKVENTVQAGEDIIRFTRGGVTMEFRAVQGVGGEVSAFQSFRNFMKTNPDAAADDLKDLNSYIRAGEDAHFNPKTTEIRDANGIAKATAAEGNWLNRAAKVMKDNPKTTIAGLSVTAFIAAAGVFLGCTDGKTATITNLAIVPNTSNTQIQVSFTPPASCFRPRLNDTFSFSGTQTTPRLDTMGDCVITKVVNKTTVIVALPSKITDIGTGNGGWGQVKCTSCFENQFVGAFSSTLTTIVATAASTVPAAVQGICDAMPGLCNAFKGIPGFFQYGWIIILICCLFCCLGLGALLIINFS
jgi:hypothetical protein